MENLELVVLKPRARRLPDQIYSVGIAVAGTEGTQHPQIILYASSANIAFLHMLVKEHNALVKAKTAKK